MSSFSNQFSPPFYDWQNRQFMVYDAKRVFDDVLGGFDPSRDEVIDACGDVLAATLRAFRKRQLRPVPQIVEPVKRDSTIFTFALPRHVVVGADEGVGEGEFPLFDAIRERFRAAIGKPKIVRLDDDVSYAEFRSARREPHLASLDERLARLERQFAAHVSDGHGSDDLWHGFDSVDDFDAYLDGSAQPRGTLSTAIRGGDYEHAVLGAVADAARGGRSVDLRLPVRGKAECWVDRDEVLLSARLPQGIATTGAPLVGTFYEVVGCAERVGCSGSDALVVGCALAPRVLGQRLLGDICRVGAHLDTPTSIVSPNSDPGLAAAMALVQRAQRGDRKAHKEILSMPDDLIGKAFKRLKHGQKQKARGRSAS